MPRSPEYDRSTVIDQAMSVFWERGYGKTSIGDLVDATGLQPGSLYAAFGSKRGVFLEVVDHYNLSFLEAMRALRERPAPAMEKINQLLQQIVDDQVAGNEHRGCLTVNSLLELSQHDADIADRLCSYNHKVRAAFALLIEDAQAEGEISAARDADGLAAFVINNIWGMRVMCKSKPEQNGLQAIVDSVIAALRAGRTT